MPSFQDLLYRSWKEGSFILWVILIVLYFSFKVSSRMSTYRTYFRSLFAFVNISAVVTFPTKRSVAFECIACFKCSQNLVVAFLVGSLNLCYKLELSGKFIESLCLLLPQPWSCTCLSTRSSLQQQRLSGCLLHRRFRGIL